LYAFLLALYAAVCWGIAPLFGKIGMRGVNPMEALAARTLVTVCFVWGWFIAKGEMGRLTAIPGKRWLFLGIEAFLATFVGDLAYYAAIKFGDIGQASVVLAASPLITLAVGRMFLQEEITGPKIVGAVLIVGGIVLVGLDAVR
jgi:transporter family protein